MNGRVAKYALLDTGFWIAMFDPTDAYHGAATRLYKRTIEPLHAIAAWPCFYEFMRTRFVRHSTQIAAFERALRLPGVERIADEPYRERALEQCLEPNAYRRPLSLVDRVLRAIAEDERNKVHAIVTVDPQDFADVCRRRGLELIQVG